MTNSAFSMFSLQDQVVVLTGAGGALTGEIAKASAACGAKVAVLDLCIESAQKVADAIRERHGEAVALQCDVLDPDSLSESLRAIVDRFGKVDCLVNGAGGNRKEGTTSEALSFFDIPAGAHQAIVDLNFLGTLLPCQVFGREIVKQKKGSIVNIASIAGFRPLTRAAAYAAAKAAVVNITKWLAVHMCQHYSTHIRVNAIAPGFCSTEQNRYLLYDPDGHLSTRGRTILGHVPQNRFGRPEEVARPAVWLLSDWASFVTGTVITVDGGFSAYSGV